MLSKNKTLINLLTFIIRLITNTYNLDEIRKKALKQFRTGKSLFGKDGAFAPLFKRFPARSFRSRNGRSRCPTGAWLLNNYPLDLAVEWRWI